MEFSTTLPTSPGLFSVGEASLFLFKCSKYIAAMPNGYKTDLVMFFQISRTLQRKRHAKRTSGAPRYDLTTSPSQKLLCIKLALSWLLFSITLL